jgi:hypothetical protein
MSESKYPIKAIVTRTSAYHNFSIGDIIELVELKTDYKNPFQFKCLSSKTEKVGEIVALEFKHFSFIK